MSNFQNLSNFLPTGVFDSLQSASNAPAPEPVGLLQEGQLRELQQTAKRKFPHLSFHQSAAKWRLERVLKLRRIITDAENKLRVWKREVTVVEQPAAFDNAISSLYHELNLTQRIERDRSRRHGASPFISDSTNSSSEESEGDEWQNPADFPDEPEPARVPEPAIVRVETDYKEEWRCAICQSSDEDNVVEPACGHPYHHQCLMGYIGGTARDGHYSCAVCRQRMSAMDQPRVVEFPSHAPASPAPASPAPASPAPASPAPASPSQLCVLNGMSHAVGECNGIAAIHFRCGHAQCGDADDCMLCGCACGFLDDAHDDRCPAADPRASPTPSTDSLGSLNERVLGHRIV